LQLAYGRGCSQDLREAYTLFQDGASRGHAQSMYYCGVFNLYGHGAVPVDYNTALMWFEQASQEEEGP
jgi:TPR repeat protein